MKMNMKKLAAAGMLTALAIVFSTTFYIPIGASKCFPVQHLINVLSAVFLGPVYGVGMAFCTSLIRNLLGTGSILAFPGSMAGAFLAGILFQKFGKLPAAYIGEIIGTGIIGALISSPMTVLLLGKEAAVFMYVVPFIMSSALGTAIAILLTGALCKTKAMGYIKQILRETS